MSDRETERVVRYIVWPGMVALIVLSFYLQHIGV